MCFEAPKIKGVGYKLSDSSVQNAAKKPKKKPSQAEEEKAKAKQDEVENAPIVDTLVGGVLTSASEIGDLSSGEDALGNFIPFFVDLHLFSKVMKLLDRTCDDRVHAAARGLWTR